MVLDSSVPLWLSHLRPDLPGVLSLGNVVLQTPPLVLPLLRHSSHLLSSPRPQRASPEEVLSVKARGQSLTA